MKNSVTVKEEMIVSRESLQESLCFYMDKIRNKEVQHIFILSNDEKKEAVMLDIEEYEALYIQYSRYKLLKKKE